MGVPDRPRLSKAVFIVWGPPPKGRRSLVLGTDLGVEEVAYLSDTWRPGVAADPLKYPRLFWRTATLLARRRPRVVFVQSPPTLAVWTVALYAALTRTRFVIDAHSDAFQRTRWTRPRWLNRAVARRAVTTLVTDQHWADRLARDAAPVLVVPDIPQPTATADGGTYALGAGFHVMVVNTWSPDEPLDQVIAAAAELPEVTFHVTGRRDRRVDALGPLPGNVRFTDFLADDDYRRLMASVQAVVCLTTRDHTMQRGACEALSAARPIVTSRWPLLQRYFSDGTVHVDNTLGEIRDGIRSVMIHHVRYAAAISALRDQRSNEWDARRAALIKLVSVSAADAAVPLVEA